MKKLLTMGFVALLGMDVLPQIIPDLPQPIGIGSAEVRGDSIYYFGGSNTWTGTIRYPPISSSSALAIFSLSKPMIRLLSISMMGLAGRNTPPCRTTMYGGSVLRSGATVPLFMGVMPTAQIN